MTSTPLVLVLEDDAAARQFVAMALESLPVQVLQAASLAQARVLLQQHSVALLLTDMTLKDGHATALVEDLVSWPAARVPKVVVLSGGIYADTRQRLTLLGVQHFLHKPASLTEIEDTVARLLQLTPATAELDASQAPAGLAPHEWAAVQTYFDGDVAFYQTYQAMSLAQFELDLQAGEDACAQSDAQTLRRTAHSMKSVLRTLGHEALSDMAKQSEDAAHLSPWPQAVLSWQALRQAVQAQLLAK